MDRIVETSRYLVLLAVIATLVASGATFVWGVWKTVVVVMELVVAGGKDPLAAVALIALMDKFLIATGLYIFAAGMYGLFFNELKVPAWLVVHSLHDIKSRLSSIVILVMAITFLERLVEWRDPQGTMFFAIAIALVTAALIAFSYFGEKN
jgi:uncharacterized membrane protein YqhA